MKSNQNIFNQQLSQKFTDWKTRQTSTPIYWEYDNNTYSIHKDYVTIVSSFYESISNSKTATSVIESFGVVFEDDRDIKDFNTDNKIEFVLLV